MAVRRRFEMGRSFDGNRAGGGWDDMSVRPMTLEDDMKRSLMILGLALITLPLAGCDDGYGYGYGGVYSASRYPSYGWYDNYYGPIHDGYWNRGHFYYRHSPHDRYRRGDRDHFRWAPRSPGYHFNRMRGFDRSDRGWNRSRGNRDHDGRGWRGRRD